MKKICIIISICVVSFSCAKNDPESKNALKSDNPTEEKAWLKGMEASLINCMCEISLIRGTYNNQTVYFTALTDPLCDGIDTPTLYDCDGKVIRIFTMNDYQEFYDKVSRDSVLYRCKTVK